MAFADNQTTIKAIIYYGESPAPILLAGTVLKGDPIGYLGGWQRADASVGATLLIQMRCVAAEDGESRQTIVAYFGTVKMGVRLSGGTVAAALYASETAGQYTETAPSDTGDGDTAIGQMLDATTCLLYPQRNHHSIA